MTDRPDPPGGGPTWPDGPRTPPHGTPPVAPTDPTWPGTAGPGPAGPGWSDPTVTMPVRPPTSASASPPPWPPAGPATMPSAPPPGRSPRRPPGVRTAIGVLLLLVAGLSAVGAVAAAWTRSQIRDEDTWAATAQALADDPAVQEAVADALAVQLIAATGADDVISGLLPGPLGALADPLTGGATDLVGTVALQVVQTDVFRAAWEEAVRQSHGEILAALDGDGRFTTIGPGGIELDLGATLGEVRQLFSERGLTLFDGVDLSGIDVRFLLVDAPGLQRLRDLLQVLDVLVVVLPLVAVGTAVVGLLVARRRSWALLAGGVGALGGAAAVWGLARLGEDRAAEAVSGGVLSQAALEVVAREVTASLEGVLVAVVITAGALVVLGLVGAVAGARRA